MILKGMLVGREALVNFQFDPKFPYQYCRICGDVFQSDIDRKVPVGHTPQNSRIAYMAQGKRQAWAMTHAKEHKPSEHEALRRSGNYCTPEAAAKLATYGIIPVNQMVTDQETSIALAEAPRAPKEDADS
jgi:hypothetical protein